MILRGATLHSRLAPRALPLLLALLAPKKGATATAPARSPQSAAEGQA